MRNQSPFSIRYMKSEYHCFMSWFYPFIISEKKAVIKYYKKKSGGRVPDLVNPQTFSEKLQWYKLNARNPIMQQCADKYAVREYVKDQGYGYILNDLLGVYTSISQINLSTFPESFVLKATHGSGWNIIVKSKSDLNWKQSKMLLRSWLHQNNAWSGGEWVYKDIPHQIVAEKFLQDENGELRDYKFFCFNGKPKYLQLEVGRYTDHNTRNFYDMDWKLMPFGKEFPHVPNIIEKCPTTFENMKKIASDLSKPFQFVRVDLYQVDCKVYFGELTFFPAGGAPDFVPIEYDAIVGSNWTLQR